MVDAAIVMVENAHKHIETWQHEHPEQVLEAQVRWNIITRSASEGPAMTMGFKVADPALLNGLTVGEKVDFELKIEGESQIIVAVKKSS